MKSSSCSSQLLLLLPSSFSSFWISRYSFCTSSKVFSSVRGMPHRKVSLI